jgi:hypothetical protein
MYELFSTGKHGKFEEYGRSIPGRMSQDFSSGFQPTFGSFPEKSGDIRYRILLPCSDDFMWIPMHFSPASNEIHSFPEAEIIDLDIETNKRTKRNSYLQKDSHIQISKKYLGSIRVMVQV